MGMGWLLWKNQKLSFPLILQKHVRTSKYCRTLGLRVFSEHLSDYSVTQLAWSVTANASELIFNTTDDIFNSLSLLCNIALKIEELERTHSLTPLGEYKTCSGGS